MKIRILKQTSINGQPARVGQLVNAADSDARTLLAIGKAELVKDAEPVIAASDIEARKPRTRKFTPA